MLKLKCKEKETWILGALASLLPALTPRKLWSLWKAAGANPHQTWRATEDTFRQAGWTPRERSLWEKMRRNFSPAKISAELARWKITMIPYGSRLYPPSLQKLSAPPLCLFARGNLDLLTASVPAITVVGTRRPSPYGKQVTKLFVRKLVEANFLIFSGLAYGIDAQAHQAALEARGITVAILGSGIDPPSCYPAAHHALLEQIVATRGLVVSEYFPGTKATRYTFPARNRLLAAWADAVLVIEAGKKSGALITAQFASEYGKEVFAVPGNITCPVAAGTNALIRDGAHPALAPEDIFLALGLDYPAPPPAVRTEKLDQLSELILAHLSDSPLHLDKLAEACKLSPMTLAAKLTMLELEGLVADAGGKRYIRTQIKT
jgi:DNA processing protein